MRKINKNTPIIGFNGNNFRSKCTNWADFSKNYSDVSKDARIKILNEEQCQLDGYTEVYIKDETKCHIDHYIKREYFPQLTFDWNNLIIASMDDKFGAKYKDNSYRIKKGEYIKIFNPINDNVEDYFYYTNWGEIKPQDNISEIDKQKVEKTIEVFNLNHESLTKRRAALIKKIECYKGMDGDDIKIALETAGFRSVVEQEIKQYEE